jgi:hypothetical protein
MEESLALRREEGDPREITISLNNLGNLALLEGNLAQAQELLEEYLSLSQELGDRYITANALQTLGVVALAWNDAAAQSGLGVWGDRGCRINGGGSVFRGTPSAGSASPRGLRDTQAGDAGSAAAH